MEELQRGLYVVSNNGKILEDVNTSGDEGCFSELFAKSNNYSK